MVEVKLGSLYIGYRLSIWVVSIKEKVYNVFFLRNVPGGQQERVFSLSKEYKLEPRNQRFSCVCERVIIG